MKVFVALFILMTLQLCLIRAAITQGPTWDDQSTSTMETIDSWENFTRCGAEFGGQCFNPWNLLNQSCDFIREAYGPEYGFWSLLCGFEDEYCCGVCNNPTLNSACHIEAGEDTTSRRDCCPGEFERGLLPIGCKCCGPCRPTRWCKRKNGFCVTRNEETNFEQCVKSNGKVYTSRRKGCRGNNCACCVIPKDNKGIP